MTERKPYNYTVLRYVTVQGLKDFCTLRSIIETARKQGWDVPEVLQTPPDKLIQMIESA